MENKYKLIPFNGINSNIWDHFVRHQSSDTWLFHTSDWQHLLKKAWNATILSFGVFEDKDLKAIFPLTILPGSIFIDSNFGPAGIAFDNNLEVSEKKEILRECLCTLGKEFKDSKAIFRIMLPGALYFENERNYEQLYSEYFQPIPDIYHSIIGFTFDQKPENVISSFRHGHKDSIRKAGKNNITIETATQNDLDDYYNLHLETYDRTGAKPHPKEYFEEIFKFMEKGFCFIKLAKFDGQTIGATNVATYKRKAWYWTGAYSDASNRYGAGALLQQACIEEARIRGCTQYEVGEVYPETTDEKLKGLTKYKSGFGGNNFPCYKFQIPINDLDKMMNNPVMETGLNMAAESIVQPKEKVKEKITNTYYTCKKFGHLTLVITPQGEMLCTSCNKIYPFIEGTKIPIFIEDVPGHINFMEGQVKKNPQWFDKNQLPQIQGPYKVHLERRRTYLDEVLTGFVQEKGGRQDLNFLDLGCGDGLNLQWIKKLSLRLKMYATDYNHVRLERVAAQNPGIEYCLSIAQDLPYDNRFFDIVFCNHVLEHISEYEAAISEIHRILKPGGIAIIGAPNEGSKWWSLAYELQPNIAEATDHVNFFKGDELRDEFEAEGFICRELKYMGYGLPHFDADSVFRAQPGIDDFMEQLGHQFFEDQASSFYLILEKE